MKSFLFITVIIFTNTVFAQQFEKQPSKTEAGKYSLSDSVEIENGRGERVKVYVAAIVLGSKWDSMVVSMNSSDKATFSYLVGMLAANARHELKNSSSFEPLKSQFFMWYEKNKTYMCNFKMMGKDNKGNMIESAQVVEWNPGKTE